MVRRVVWVAAGLTGLAAVLPGPSMAQPGPGAAVSPATESAATAPDLSLTIYNSNLALVQDHRTVDVPAGRSRLELKDVSAAIRPETATLTGAGLAVVEQNFDYDLLTPAKMMEKAVGRQVQIVRTNPGDGRQTTETATVLSANDGVVLRIGDQIEVLRDDGVPTRVIFDRVPESLRAQPTLSVMVNAARAGPRPVDLSYLTTGLSWKADYVALFDEARGALDFQGWITLSNTSGTAFAQARTLLVAGDVALEDAPQMQPGMVFRRIPQSRPTQAQAGTETSAAPRVGDFYVYPLPERTTVADKQTKQVGFVQAPQVQARKVYEYRSAGMASADEPQHVDVAIDFANSAAAGLGRPLPAGVVRVYQRDATGQAQVVGESAIDHTPQGSALDLKTGEAFDVTVQPTLVSSETVSPFMGRYHMSYRFRNAKPQPVTVEFRQGGVWPNGQILEASAPGRRLDDDTFAWSVPVPAGGETVLTFTAQTGE